MTLDVIMLLLLLLLVNSSVTAKAMAAFPLFTSLAGNVRAPDVNLITSWICCCYGCHSWVADLFLLPPGCRGAGRARHAMTTGPATVVTVGLSAYILPLSPTSGGG